MVQRVAAKRGDLPTLEEDGPIEGLSSVPVGGDRGRATVAQLQAEAEKERGFKLAMDRNKKAFILALVLLSIVVILTLLDFFFYERATPPLISYLVPAIMVVVGFLCGSGTSSNK